MISFENKKFTRCNYLNRRLQVSKREVDLIKWHNWRTKINKSCKNSYHMIHQCSMPVRVFMITYQEVSWQGTFQYCELPSKQSSDTFNMNSNASHLLHVHWVKLKFTSLAFFSPTLPVMVNPWSAITMSPGISLSRRPQFSVMNLSETLPPHASDTHEIVPCGFILTRILIVL